MAVCGGFGRVGGDAVTMDLVGLRKYAEGFRRGYPAGASVVAIDPDELLALIEAVEAARESVEKSRRAASRWRDTAAKQKQQGNVSEIAGETDVPSHVLSTVRAIMWDAAARDLAAALAPFEAQSGKPDVRAEQR